jgi:hypothetical protein
MKGADALGDMAQISFASFFIPLFFGQASFFQAFIGGSIAAVL